MPATLNPGDILKIRQVCFWRGQLGINVLFYRIVATAGVPKDATICSQIDNLWAPAMKSCLHQLALYRGIGLQRVWPSPVTEVSSVANAGLGVGAPFPAEPQMCAVITKRTGFTGRKNRGRVYVPFHGISDIDATNGQPNAGYQVNLGIWAAQSLLPTTYGVGPDTIDVVPVLAKRGTGTPPPYTSIDITSFNLQPKFGGQHRRGDYGKPNVLPF